MKGGKTRTCAEGLGKENRLGGDTPAPPQQTATSCTERREGGGQTTSPADGEGEKVDKPG